MQNAKGGLPNRISPPWHLDPHEIEFRGDRDTSFYIKEKLVITTNTNE